MTLGLREKLFGVSVVLIAAVGLASGLYVENRLRSWIVDRIETEVLTYAQSTRTFLESVEYDQNAADVDPLADRMGEATGARITIIDRNGRVLGDSALPLEAVRSVENHADRPEIRDALRRGRGTSRRHSATLDREMYYVALPFDASNLRGVVRASLPLAAVDETVRQLRWTLGAAALFGLVVAIFMSGLASHWVTRNLGSLVSRVRDVARTDETRVESPEAGFQLEDSSVEGLADQLERAVDRLARQRDRMEAILESMREAVLVVDEDREIELANPTAAELLDLDDAPSGESLADAVDLPGLEELCERATAGDYPEEELELAGEDTKRLMVRAAREPATGAVVVVLHDVTELRRLERVRRDFVANVSHELRTPVSIIQANAETLQNGALDDPEHGPKFVDSLLRTAERMSELIDDLLELSRLEADERALELESIRLAPFVEDCLEELRPRADDRNVDLESELDEDLEALADPKALRQVLLNLVGNAIKYIQEEGNVWLRGRVEGDRVVVEVHDNGPGIDEKHRDRVFERFYRVDEGRSRDEGGTGLGLAIAKHLVQNMGGEVGYRPAKVRGSVFWFALRRQPPANPGRLVGPVRAE